MLEHNKDVFPGEIQWVNELDTINTVKSNAMVAAIVLADLSLVFKQKGNLGSISQTSEVTK